MRFAGQAVRNAGRQGRMGMPNFRAEDGAIGDMAYRPQVQGLEQSINQMPAKVADSWTKTSEPVHGKAPVVEPEFRA